MIIENLINKMLGVKVIDSKQFLLENKSKLKYVGELETKIDFVPLRFDEYGFVQAVHQKDEHLGKELNKFVYNLKKELIPLIDYIKNDVFQGEDILSQELVIHEDIRALAICDLSSQSTVLEIKAGNYINPQAYAKQIYYESKGRNAYLLQVDWRELPSKLSFILMKLSFKTYYDVEYKRIDKIQIAKDKLETTEIELVNYVNSTTNVILKCKKCGYLWSESYYKANKHLPCPKCAPKPIKPKRKRASSLTQEDKIKKRANKFYEKIVQKSKGSIEASNYKGSKETVCAKCLICGYKWDTRADHLLDRCYCSMCARHIKHI